MATRSRIVSGTVSRFNSHPILGIIGIFLAIALLTYNFSLLNIILIYGLFAMAYNISLGQTGIITFGHAAFFGLGAYGAAIPLAHLGIPPWLALATIIVGVMLSAVGGAIFGLIALQRRGTYLALITLALAQLVYFLFYQWEAVTGGDNGLYGITTPELGIPGVFSIPINSPELYFIFTVLIFGVAAVVLYRLLHSNFGRALAAVRDNEQRARYMGYNVDRLRLGSFTISAAFSGLAGALYTFHLNFVGLGTLNWVLSGEVNFFVILGGVHTFGGPVIGAGLYYVIKDALSVQTELWEIPVGLIFIAIVLFFPEGIVGTIKEWLAENTEMLEGTQSQAERTDGQVIKEAED